MTNDKAPEPNIKTHNHPATEPCNPYRCPANVNDAPYVNDPSNTPPYGEEPFLQLPEPAEDDDQEPAPEEGDQEPAPDETPKPYFGNGDDSAKAMHLLLQSADEHFGLAVASQGASTLAEQREFDEEMKIAMFNETRAQSHMMANIMESIRYALKTQEQDRVMDSLMGLFGSLGRN